MADDQRRIYATLRSGSGSFQIFGKTFLGGKLLPVTAEEATHLQNREEVTLVALTDEQAENAGLSPHPAATTPGTLVSAATVNPFGTQNVPGDPSNPPIVPVLPANSVLGPGDQIVTKLAATVAEPKAKAKGR